jgi:prolyl 4-hydroxylase
MAPLYGANLEANVKQKSKISFLSVQWQQWIRDNLERGCSVDSLVDAMVEQNFERTAALGFVQQYASPVRAASVAAVPATMSARHVQDLTGLSTANHTYVYEAPRLAQTDSLIKTPDRDVRVSLRMARPVVAVFDNMLSLQECDELVRLARIKLKRSTIVDPTTGREEVIEERSSFGTFFTLIENEFIMGLERRISAVMNMPIENGEGLQILNYKVGGEYKPHFDYFAPGEPGSTMHMAKGGQRVSTLIMYLNDVDLAGETVFPDIGLAVVPKKGAAVYFEYCNSMGQVDPQTLHAGAPVGAGEKWIATKWMRQSKYG